MRRGLALIALLAGALLAGSAPAAVGPPRLLGLSISNGGHPFAGDTRQLATVSPNGDGLRDRAIVRFHLDQAATVELQVVATASQRVRPKVMWRLRRSLAAGPHELAWKPARATPDRTYLLRFVVRGKNGSRVYGFERPRPGRMTSGLVVRILGVDAAFEQRGYPVGAQQAAATIATDARSVRVQFFGYPGPGSPGELDTKTGASAMSPAVTLDWRSHRDGPSTVDFSPSGSWPTGLYFLRVTTSDGRVGYAPLVLRPRHLGEHRVAVVLPTNTWGAENLRDMNGDGWGDSWLAAESSTTVNLGRPYLDSGIPYRFRAESGAVISWLSRTGKHADYLSDDDLAAVPSGEALRSAYDLVVFAGSDQYVGRHAYDLVRRFRDLGGRLMFLSGANFRWEAERRGPTLRRGKTWRQLGKPEAAVVGVQFAASGRSGGKAYVVQGAGAEPWAFAATGLADGSAFGRFGTEVDSTSPQTPAGTVVLARIANAIGRHDAEMTYYRTASGGQVFAAGTRDFARSLDQPAVAQLVANVWALLS
ncbi:MAG TPA: N,N-dimethylformamidase beta subunit family domain-containing protein [Gaiellaceae bacterium]